MLSISIVDHRIMNGRMSPIATELIKNPAL